MEKKYYKIVCNGMSVNTRCMDSYFCVKYEVGKWTYPKIELMSLTVFDSLESVETALRGSMEFCNRISGCELYECEIGKIKKPHAYVRGGEFYIKRNFSKEVVKELMKINNTNYKDYYKADFMKSGLPVDKVSFDFWPLGTVFTNRIKLIKKMEGWFE